MSDFDLGFDLGSLKRVGLVGGGVIGAGWAARFALNGVDVAVYDPDPEIGRKLDAVLGNARRAQAKLMPGITLPEGKVRVASSIEDAVDGAGFVQESLPEREDLKRELLGRIDRALPADVVIGSSTSGLLPSRLQADMAHPGRLVVGHPFNPVYLLPLVEICGGARTVDWAKRQAEAIYRAIGMRPLQVRKEVDGFIADRLLEALWREALWLVNDGIATTEEIDDAVRFGAGLRWSFMGTFLIYRLAGGEAGMRHFMSQFGPALKLPWTKLEAPELTEELLEAVTAQSDDQARGVSIRELERRRDDCLVAVLSGLRAEDYGAGAVVREAERRLAAHLGGGAKAGNGHAEAALLRLHEAAVPPDWIDYNGHMTEHRYLQMFGETTDALLARIGVDAGYLAGGHSYYTAETHIRHLGEARLGERLSTTTQILAADTKRLHVFHGIWRDGALLATAEQMLLHVDTGRGKVAPAEGAVLDAVARLAALHAGLERPDGAGRSVGVR